MSDRNMPNIFRLLLSDMCIDKPDIAGTSDGFFVVNKSIANILSVKEILIFRIQAEKGLHAVNSLTTGFYMPFQAITIIHIVF